MNKKKMLEFESQRARKNLEKSIEYRKALEWVMVVLAIEEKTYNNYAIIEEIEKVLN